MWGHDATTQGGEPLHLIYRFRAHPRARARPAPGLRLPIRARRPHRAAPPGEQRSGDRRPAPAPPGRDLARAGAPRWNGREVHRGDGRAGCLPRLDHGLGAPRPRGEVALTGLVFTVLLAFAPAGVAGEPLPFGPGERVAFRITYARLLAGRAWVSVLPGEPGGRPVLRFVAEAKSQGFFAWLVGFRVDDRTVATWEPASGCSLAIEKRLREGRAVRDQSVVFDREEGVALVTDPKIKETRFEVGSCVLDVLSAFFVTRLRGVPETGELTLPVFDNGKRYALGVRFLKKERLNLPAPLGRGIPTIVVEPRLIEGTGLFVKEGRLRIWLTDDERRIPVRMRSKVAIGSVSADLEAYTRSAIHGQMSTTASCFIGAAE